MTKDSKTDRPIFPYFNKLLQEIKLEKPSFNSEIEIGDLLNPLFIQPNMTNSRIQNQQGAFLLSGLCDNLNTCTERLNSRVAKQRIIVKASAKKKILAQLDNIGINKGTVYPNIEKIADYLKNL